MALHGMLLQQKLLLAAFILAGTAASQPDSSCNNTCGNLSIPYPFGTSRGCYLDESFLITCDYSSETPKPFLGGSTSNIDVFDISLLDGELQVSSWVASDCYDASDFSVNSSSIWFELPYFYVSHTKNKFTAVGCDTFAYIEGSGDNNYTTGCTAFCNRIDSVVNSSCSGLGCCQTTIAEGIWNFNLAVNSFKNYSEVRSFNPCGFAFLVEAEAYNFSSLDLKNLQNRESLPLVVDWAVGKETCEDAQKNKTSYACKAEYSYCYNSTNGPGYRCNCSTGFEGNPYLPHGCTDIDECKINPNPCDINTQICNNFAGDFNCSCREGYEDDGSGKSTCRPKVKQYRLLSIALSISSGLGLLVLFVGGWLSYKVVKKRRRIKQKNQFFKQNGGLLLQQQLSSHEANVENTKLFTSKDLEKATDRFNANRILGQGGQGTVYKGMLADGRIVAVKKSKVIDEGKLGEFINEVVILSQINHRNVVKLIGCCLETEVPMLVYEYIPNGTLFQYVNGQIEEFPLTWDMRLQIATDVAGALFYLHSAASTPIYHRDIKSTNILLDDKYRAKVADFGTSRSINIDQTHLTTLVHGTFGYLDPEYLQSSQFTEKSDVYSFGVVLAELLTSEKAISSTRAQESKSLATYFIQSVDENNLFDIIDNRVLNEGKKEEIIAVANLTKRCLNLNGKKRPIMKEVAMELEAIHMLQKAPKLQQNYEEVEYVLEEMYKPWDDVATNSMSSSSIDTQALLSS